MKKTAILLALVMLLSVFAFSCQKDDVSGDNNNEQNNENTSWDMPYQYDLTPYITVGEYKGIAYETEKIEVTEEDIDAAIESVLESSATYVDVERGAQMGDLINIDYTGYLDGEAFENGSDTDFETVLGEAGFIDGFEDGLVGVAAGQTVDLNLTFPDPYLNNEELSGAAVVFTVTMNSVQEEVLPELTDEFVAGLEIEGVTDIASYRTFVSEALLTQAEDNRYYTDRNAIWEIVKDNATVISYPEEEYDAKYNEVMNYYEQTAASMETTLDEMLTMYSMTMEDIETEAVNYAENMTGEELLFFSIAKLENIVPTKEDFDAYVEYYAPLYGLDAETFLLYFEEDTIWRSLLWDLVMEVIYDSAIITEAQA